MLILSSLVLCLVAGAQQLSITDFAVPSVAPAGENAELQCRYVLESNETEKELFVKWWWTPLNSNSDNRKQIYQRIAGQKPQMLLHDLTVKDNDTIVLTTLEPKDSGIYECEVSDIVEDRRHQELVVYTQGSGPEINITLAPDGPDEDQDVQVSCEATDVAPQPELTITVNGKPLNSSHEVIGPEAGLYSVFANATVSKDVIDGAEIKCELFYVNNNIVHPLYIDTEIYDASGPQSTPEVPDDVTESEPTADSVQNEVLNGDRRLRNSWLLLVVAAIPMHLLTL